MQHEQAAISADQQGDTDDAQGFAALRGMAALGQRRALGEGVDLGEEVGGVEQDAVQVDAEHTGHAAT